MTRKSSLDKELLLRQLCMVVLDFSAIVIAAIGSMLIRFDSAKEMKPYMDMVVKTLLPNVLVTLFIFWAFRLYHSVWRYAGFHELQQIAFAVVCSTAALFLIMCIYRLRVNRSFWILYPGLLGCCVVFTRFFYRILRRIRKKWMDFSGKSVTSRVMIIGAGAAADVIIREIKNSDHLHKTVECVIDDNEDLWGKQIQGRKIIGGRQMIVDAAKQHQINEIIIAMPSVSKSTIAEIARICNETGCTIKTLPGVYQLVNDEVSVSSLRQIEIEDLLGREPIVVDTEQITGYLKDKTVMVTGGGGSIGSELCRQIASAEPKCLIIFDIYENNAYDIQLELKEKYPKLNLVTLIGSVRDSRKIFNVFETYRPDIVYHAAAHKHVPLMEDSPCEAVKNNIIGTYKTAFAALSHGCKRFVLISTDKAVNPTNIMGASKRAAEMVIDAFAAKIKEGKAYEIPQLFTHSKSVLERPEIVEALKTTKTEFVAVRFGNVLGSNGSVIPIFKKQIAKGGPVTVTHPDIIRYFMTIPEAVGLVLQAGLYAHGGEIFVLDMGEPVKIDTLARNLIRLSGYKPDEDIKIEYTGLRPGEKLYEEKLMAEEGLRKTENDLIHIGNPIPMDVERFFGQLSELMEAAYKNREDICEVLSKIVVTYQPKKEEKVE